MRRTLSAAAFACLLACLAPAAPGPAAARAQGPSGPAQTRPAPADQAAPPSGEGAAPADLSVTARVEAESLVFRKVPNPRVEFPGRPRRDTVWETDRTNLPEQVQPGVTYRDIGITLRITSVFADIERIVAEALGELPASPEPAPEGPGRDDPARPGAPTRPGDAPAPAVQPTPADAAETSRADTPRAESQRAGTKARRRAPAREGRGQ